MIEFNVKNIRIGLDFSFFAVMAFCFFLDKNGILMMSLAACVLHETGHLIAMIFFDIEIRSLYFFGAGIKLGCDIRKEGLGKSIIVLLAGSAANMIACIFSFSVCAYSFAAVNLVIGIFNLLSIGDLDGKQLVLILSERYLLSTLWLKLSTLFSCALVILLSLFCGKDIGITFYLTLLYMLMIR